MCDFHSQKETIKQNIKDLNVDVIRTKRLLDNAKLQLHLADIKGLSIEWKQDFIKGLEEKISTLNMQIKESWDMLYKIEQQEKG